MLTGHKDSKTESVYLQTSFRLFLLFLMNYIIDLLYKSLTQLLVFSIGVVVDGNKTNKLMQ